MRREKYIMELERGLTQTPDKVGAPCSDYLGGNHDNYSFKAKPFLRGRCWCKVIEGYLTYQGLYSSGLTVQLNGKFTVRRTVVFKPYRSQYSVRFQAATGVHG